MRLKALRSTLQVLPSRVQELRGTGWRAGKTTSAQRGYGYKWQKAREAHLLENPLCVMCQAEGRVVLATVVDHIRPHRGDQALFEDAGNVQSLCASHHSGEKQRQERQDMQL